MHLWQPYVGVFLSLTLSCLKLYFWEIPKYGDFGKGRIFCKVPYFELKLGLDLFLQADRVIGISIPLYMYYTCKEKNSVFLHKLQPR